MNIILPLLSIIVGSMYIHIGIYALTLDKKGRLNRLFFLIALTCAFWSFSLSLFLLVRNRLIAYNFFLIALVGPFYLPALGVHYTFVLTNRGFIKKRRYKSLLLYIPAIICSIGLFIPGVYIKEIFPSRAGWIVRTNELSLFVWIYVFYNFIYHIYNMIQLFRWMVKSKSIEIKKQAFIIIVTFMLSVLLVYIEEVSIHVLKIQSCPSLSHFFSLIWFLGIFIVIKKYWLMVISPEKAIKEILYNMMDFLIFTDNKGIIKKTNQRLTQLLGVMENELKGSPVDSLFKEELLLSDIRTFTQCRKEINTKDSKTITVLLRVSPIKNNDSVISGYLLIGHDIHERKILEKEIMEREHAEKKLLESEDLYISTINAMDEMIHVVDSELNIILYNEAFFSIAKGFKKDIVTGKSKLIEIFSFLTDQVIKEYKEVLETGKTLVTEETSKIGGKFFYTETRKIPVVRNRRIAFVVTIIRDITEKKRIDQMQLRSQVTDSVGLLASGIAHDYNNLLTTILGNITLARYYYPHKTLHDEALAEAENAGLQAKDLSEQLLTFSHNGTLVKKSGDIGKLLKKSASFFLSGSNIKCEIDIPVNLYSTRFDKQQIARVFQNLLLNAKEAMPDGGILIIKAKNMLINNDSKGCLQAGKYLEISFKDSGKGIDDKILPRIFNPYFTTKETGSGLGLATAYSIMKQHGGNIEVISAPGEGSTFTLCLPADELKEEEESRKKSRELKKGKGSILIMDDDGHVRETLKRLLEHLGYIVVDTDNGDDVIALYKNAYTKRKRFDLVILDYTIQGGENGGEIFIKLLEYDSDINVIIYSGYGGKENFMPLMQKGLKGVVKKPFDIVELSELLDKIITDEK